MNFVSSIVGDIDTAVNATAAQYFQVMSASIQSLYTALLGLLFAFIGIMVALNVYAMAMRDAVQIGIRIVLVFVFALTWANFQILYDTLTNTSQNIALSYFSIGGAGTNTTQPDIAMDQFSTDMANLVDIVTQAMGSVARGVVGALLYGALAVLMAVYVLVVAFSKIMIAFLLGLAPLAMAATTFERTKTFFEAWLSAFIGYFMYPIAAAGIIGTVINVSNNFAVTGPPNSSTLGSILGFLVVIFVGVFALKSIPQAVSNITGQFNLAGISPQALSLVGSPGGYLGGKLKTRAQAYKSGLIHGTTPRMAGMNTERHYADKGAGTRKRVGNVTQKLAQLATRRK
ncbi:MAG: type IV secretion system protein [Albidovulum sp.]|uniref:type IV secretion system protein n=1 Tax=Albidovulum sp. TaxID=1872424 RepID=UPI003CB5007E